MGSQAQSKIKTFFFIARIAGNLRSARPAPPHRSVPRGELLRKLTRGVGILAGSGITATWVPEDRHSQAVWPLHSHTHVSCEVPSRITRELQDLLLSLLEHT